MTHPEKHDPQDPPQSATEALMRAIEMARRDGYRQANFIRRLSCLPRLKPHEMIPPLSRPPVAARAAQTAEPDPFVNLDQIAAIAGRKKNYLQNLLGKGEMPAPDIQGGAGKPNEWRVSTIRPWILERFNRPVDESLVLAILGR